MQDLRKERNLKKRRDTPSAPKTEHPDLVMTRAEIQAALDRLDRKLSLTAPDPSDE